MRRRQALGTLLGLPAFTALPAFPQAAPAEKTKAPASEKSPAELKPAAPEEIPGLAMTAADTAASPAPHFFSSAELQTLRKLADAIVPAAGNKPGAQDAGVPEFLDFLIEASPAARQDQYRQGLRELEQQAQAQFGQSFADLGAAGVDKILAPLRAPWTFAGPEGSLAQFLVSAKEDILRATLNSRQWAATATGRRARGLDTYWYPVE